MRKLLAVGMGLVLLVGALALAAAPTVVSITWDEDAARYDPDGTLVSEVSGYLVGPVEFRKTGNVYHMLGVESFYIGPGRSGFQGKVVVSGGGHLSGHVTFSWDKPNLRGRELLEGNVTIDPSPPTPSFEGTYVAYTYAFGSAEEVLNAFPEAVPEKSSQSKGWWFVFYTEYTAY